MDFCIYEQVLTFRNPVTTNSILMVSRPTYPVIHTDPIKKSSACDFSIDVRNMR